MSAAGHAPDAGSAEQCPIEALWSHLVLGEPPPLAWVVRWSRGGAEPVAAAWAAARDPSAMCWLLSFYDAPRYDALAAAVWRRTHHALARGPHGAPGDSVRVCAATELAYCEALRAAVPVPPTLLELLAGARREAGR